MAKRSVSLLALLCVVVGAHAATLRGVATSLPVVETTLGPVQGTFVTSGSGSGSAAQWLGIPYAATTADENRFMPPQPRAHYGSTFDASNWGPGCIETGSNPDVPKVQSEDCLNVNVWAPTTFSSSSNLPVMVFIFGGAFVEGSNRGPFDMYDSAYTVAGQDVVIATCNYRVGPFGWMVTKDGVNGNMGLLDQRMCMEWVRDNIANFGGDPSQVTIWGESAGAMSVGLHLISPGSAGLFNRIIMESNPAGYKYRDVSQQEDYGDKACDNMGCKPFLGSCNTTCMQHVTTAAVSAAWAKAAKDYVIIGEANWGNWLEAALGVTPTVDGDVIPTTVQQALLAGSFAKNVDVLVGTNQNEGTTFVYAIMNKTLSKLEFDALADAVWGSNAKAVKDAYANFTNVPSDDYRDVLSRILTDGWFRCPSERFATEMTNAGSAAYVYTYNHPHFSGASLFDLFGMPVECHNKTCHEAELPFVFHLTEYTPLGYSMTPQELILSQGMVEYWSSFGKTGKPESPTAKFEWPQWVPATRPNIILQEDYSTENSIDLCNFWDSVGYNF